MPAQYHIDTPADDGGVTFTASPLDANMIHEAFLAVWSHEGVSLSRMASCETAKSDLTDDQFAEAIADIQAMLTKRLAETIRLGSNRQLTRQRRIDLLTVAAGDLEHLLTALRESDV